MRLASCKTPYCRVKQIYYVFFTARDVRFVRASRDQVTVIRGVAGAGKTPLLKELDERLAEAEKKLL